MLRRVQPDGTTEPLVVGELVVDPVTREAMLGGGRLDLSRREFDLLHLLARRAGEVVTKRDILAEVWNQPYGGGERTVDVHLSWLRRKLGRDGRGTGLPPQRARRRRAARRPQRRRGRARRPTAGG